MVTNVVFFNVYYLDFLFLQKEVQYVLVLAFNLEVKIPLGTPTSHIRVPESSAGSILSFSFLIMCTLGGSRS